MGRIASTARAMATAAADGGLLLAPATDLWCDWGLLGVPDPDRATTTRQGLLFRDFIRSAFPTFQFHRLTELLIELLQQVAEGQLTRLIVCCPPRHGKACSHDTAVPTPQGCRRHGDLQPGDQVFGPDGKPTRVLALSPESTMTMRVTTSRGEQIWCHPQHEWTVWSRRCRRWQKVKTRFSRFTR